MCNFHTETYSEKEVTNIICLAIRHQDHQVPKFVHPHMKKNGFCSLSRRQCHLGAGYRSLINLTSFCMNAFISQPDHVQVIAQCSDVMVTSCISHVCPYMTQQNAGSQCKNVEQTSNAGVASHV
jgi:hypothetical protein